METRFVSFKAALLFSALCLASCATSNYAPVVYHDPDNPSARGTTLSAGDPAAMRANLPPASAPVKPVTSQALGMTVTSLPPPNAQPIEAEQPHSLAPPDTRYGVTPAERQGVASAPPIALASSQPAPTQVAMHTNAALLEPYSVIVQPGETLYSLSRAHNVSRDSIIAINNLSAPYELRMGERIIIPAGPEGAAAGMTASVARPSVYTVQPGDTLYGIARTQSADVSQIAALNNLSAPYGVRTGQQLKLPGTTYGDTAVGGPLLRLGESPIPPANAPRPRVAPPVAESAPVQSPAPAPTLASTAPRTPFAWPVSGRVISTFGPKELGRRNDGLNIAAPIGTPVRAARGGEVIYVGNGVRGYGNLVLIRHDGGYVSAYAHNSRILVERGATVRQGQQISESGDTGGVTEPQVHFEIRKDTHAIDPISYLPKA